MAQTFSESPLVPRLFPLLIVILALCIQGSPSFSIGENKLLNITIAIQNGGVVLANTTALVDYNMMGDGGFSFHTWITSEDASSWDSNEVMLITNRTVPRRNQSTDEVQGILKESDIPYNQTSVLRAPYWVKIAADVVHTINKCVLVTLGCIVVADMGYHYILKAQKTPRHHLRENF
ncbi:unnamed protein product [Allacma fusca]|uniref:Uncharacterized protein n=1 Tax=Allacma fusca TaxID=39272 RepID=A0A8J2JG62_9HEXA|nr:unnamed protein product [Allacma fusca]